MQKPALGGFGGVVDYIDYKIMKFGALVLIALVWGIFCGFTGRSLTGARLGRSQNQEGH